MSDDELVIWVDEHDRELGRVPRKLVHNKEKLLLHRETMELLFLDEMHTKFWMQKRSMTKDQHPGCWTLSVTCHVDPSDITNHDKFGYLTAGLREGLEEMGVKVINQQLIGVLVIKSDVNLGMAGVVVADYEGEPKAEPGEIDELKLFDKMTLKGIVNKLTPSAKVVLEYLKILDN